MRKILLFISLCLPIASIAQKIEKEDVDKFNGVKTITTTKERITVGLGKPSLSIQGVVFSNKTTEDPMRALYFYTQANYSGSLVPDESGIVLLLDDSTPINLVYKGKYKLFSPGDLVIIYVSLTKDQLKLAEGHKVTDVRLNASLPIDIKIKEKQQDIIPNIMKLIADKQ